MRVTKSSGGLSVRAYSGSTGVLLAMDVTEKRRKGLLGFALERKEGKKSPFAWREGMLHFPGVAHEVGHPIPTNLAPVQKFRWSDYTVFPGTDYEYRIHPVYGKPSKLDVDDGISIALSTHGPKDKHFALFNRAAAASQAFSRKFPDVDKFLKSRKDKSKPDLPAEAKDWLSRGVKEQIVKFIEEAKDSSWAIDIAIYEYEHEDIIKAVNDAFKNRKVNVRIVYHAKPNDEQTKVNEENLKALPAAVKRARVTRAIHHNKFIVLSRLKGKERVPKAVLCGSTNFTFNGVYLQANVVHVAREPGVAEHYLKLFEVLFEHPGEPLEARKYIDQENAFGEEDLYIGFSPRSKRLDLEHFIKLVGGAGRDVLFCTAFDLYKPLLEALKGAPHDSILRFGLQNKKSSITGFHADRTAEFEASALLSKSGLESLQKEAFKPETYAGQKGGIHIHTKIVVVDFTSDAPIIFSGSHNLSENASAKNDENFLVIRGNRDLADIYGIEILRLYDHYRFRFIQAQAKTDPKMKKWKAQLAPDDSWTKPYFQPGLKQSDRLRFTGQ